MNKRQKLQVYLAAFFVVYIIVWLFIPGWEASKILGILSGVLTLMAIYYSYKAEEKNKTNTDKYNSIYKIYSLSWQSSNKFGSAHLTISQNFYLSLSIISLSGSHFRPNFHLSRANDEQKVAHVPLFQPIYFAYSIIKSIFALKNWHMCHKFIVQWR